MNNLPRLLKVSFQRITRNPYNAFAAIFVMFLTFFISGLVVLVTVSSNQVLGFFESRPQVTAFLKDGTTSDKIKEIQDRLNKTEIVSKTKYISKEEALEIYKARFSSEPLLTEFVTAEILPASIEVSTYKLADLSSVAEILRSDSSVDEVIFERDIVETLQAWVKAIRNIGSAVVVFLVITSFLITLIVVGLNISLHKDEIEIMKLVGAGAWYVRTPFIFEGVFYGLFSALLASLVLLGLFLWMLPVLQSTFVDIPIFHNKVQTFGLVLAGEVLVGSVIGIVGSLVATRKYLNV
ncbi:MAG: hypothetical protein A3A57_00035 [Candidatus Woykebacteria bacterium RIFCSPLOWO2_01_FULL_41_12]|uniref:Cell division protein FtsX n=1 Tax=Candidatus Woykebacteria bacterium RIFCSPLOWO2_01_FULL_41_12 TaxID=1802604 RepID=A0A1G1X0B6_9BACT|nr:MAG: hypothetical protein A3A57_00035 [Candidatus Woykebacteria bacterium RIFCSPLOWO2_01_FULL_41_12]